MIRRADPTVVFSQPSCADDAGNEEEQAPADREPESILKHRVETSYNKDDVK